MNNPCIFDHITITAPTLEKGSDLVYRSLGVKPQKGGEHPRMGTHNLFLRLGDSIFLEIIAINPAAEKPERARWFDLDNLEENSLPRLMTWIVRTDDIKTTLQTCSEPIGEIEPMRRGDTNWFITIPANGSLPIKGAAPALIQWETEKHPASFMQDLGLSLEKLQIFHPEPQRISDLLTSIKFDGQIELLKGTEVRLKAFINTPSGTKELSN